MSHATLFDAGGRRFVPKSLGVDATYDAALSLPRGFERTAGHAIVVGDDRVALTICARLREYEGDGCVLLGARASDVRAIVELGGTRFVPGDPTERETLVRADIANARSLMLLSDDDRLNLQIALRARDLNPDIRIVMRQFNRALGRKIAAKLANTSVVSLASQSAAIFASATIDAANYYGVQFPDIDGPLFGFAERSASELGVGSRTVAAAERLLACRILAVDGEIATDDVKLSADAKLVTFARVPKRARTNRRRGARRSPSIARAYRGVRGGWRRADPLARRLTISALVFFVLATTYFVTTLHLDAMTAAYFVLTTMTTTGYGDIVPHATDHFEQLATMTTMLAGVGMTGLFVALVAANFTQARYRAQQGLRRIDASGHIIVCGAGRVGSRVIDFLVALGREVVVIEREPRSEIVERAREREFSLLTGDATADATLALCNLAEADAIVALTENDTMNLEVILGAQAINPALPVVMRVLEGDFAESIAKHFRIDRTFGAADLVSPVLAGLSFSADVRGFLTIAGREYGLSQAIASGAELARISAIEGTIVLAFWRGDRSHLVSSYAEIETGDAVLYLYPAYRYRRM